MAMPGRRSGVAGHLRAVPVLLRALVVLMMLLPASPGLAQGQQQPVTPDPAPVPQSDAPVSPPASPLATSPITRDAGGPPEQVDSPILLVDPDRLFRDSSLGQDLARTIEQERQRQEAETRRIEEELMAEELALTRERDTLDPVEFRARADAFDAKVEQLRRDRDQAEQDLVARIDATKAEFLQQIRPILVGIMRETGAQLILDRRVALMAATEIDITDLAIARIDALFSRSGPPASPTDSPTDSPTGSTPDNAEDPAAGDSTGN